MNKEDQLIERICQRLGSPTIRTGRTLAAKRGVGLALGPGDDACVLRSTRGREWVASADAFLENVHFIRRLHPPASIGYKALARATSDLAAMGAAPRCFLLSLALPRKVTTSWLNSFLGGMSQAARKFGMALAGGDTSCTDAIAINLTVLGEVPVGWAIPRSGARSGDRVFVTGRLGAAQLGLEILLRGLSHQANLRRYLVPHFFPDPPIALGRWLSLQQLPSAMIDLSDGLSTDLDRLCRSSAVGARISEANLPVVHVPESLRRRGIDARDLARNGGEDYQLLFTVPARFARRIPRRHSGVRITEIGEIVRACGVQLISKDGSAAPLTPRGWDHFGQSSRTNLRDLGSSRSRSDRAQRNV
ncbi:MAG: thiamine-phosphate kinase [Candidatus Acidiferrales bacterium]